MKIRLNFLFTALLLALPLSLFGATDTIKKDLTTGSLINGFHVPTSQSVYWEVGSKIGVGVASPLWDLDINGPSTSGVRVLDTVSGTYLIFQTANNIESGLTALVSSGPFIIAPGGSEQFRVSSAGATIPKLILPVTNLGTIAGGGTATLTNAATVFRAVFSGSTATIALPSSPPDGKVVINGTSTYSAGAQVITVPALVRPEQDAQATTTSFTIPASTSGLWTAEFVAQNGAFTKFSVVGDALSAGGGGGTTTATGNQLLTGGGVAWALSGNNITVSAATYLLQGIPYSSPETNLTLAASDATLDRIDVIAVNSSGAAVVITGTPAASPVEPSVDPETQLRLSIAKVDHATTTPTVISVDLYHENTEWTTAKSGTPINLASTVNPRSGSVDIETTAATTGNYFQFTKPASGTFDPVNYQSLVFYVGAKSYWGTTRSWSINLMNSNTVLGTTVTFKHGSFGFNSNSVAYQQIVIPMSLFGANGLTANRIRFTCAGSGTTLGAYFDDFTLQGGFAPVVDNASMHWIGPWDANLTYNRNDVVTNSSIQYVALATNLNKTPASNLGTFWAVSAPGGTGSVTSVAASVPAFLSILGSPITTSGTLAISYSGTALPVANGGTGLTSLGSGIPTWLGTPSSTNLASALTDETGTGAAVFGTSPTFTTQATIPKVVYTGSVIETSGTGSPESVVTAAVGSLYHRTDGSTGTTLYVKESGSGTTGWVAVAAGGGSGTVSAATSGQMAYYTGSTTVGGSSAATQTLGSNNLWDFSKTGGQATVRVTGDYAATSHISNSATLYADVYLQNSAGRYLDIIYTGPSFASTPLTSGLTGEFGSIATNGAFPIQFGTNGAFAGLINNAQEWQLGSTTDAGAYKLQVTGSAIEKSGATLSHDISCTLSTGFAALQVINNSVNYAYLNVYGSAYGSAAPLTGAATGQTAILGTSGAIPLQFGANGIYAGQFSTAGRTLLNTTTDDGTNQLQVNGATKVGGVLTLVNTSAPGSNPVGGAYLYAESGAIKSRGSSGTVTTVAVADPHCPICHSDFVHEWENPRYGYLAICMNCFADGIKSQTRVKGAWKTHE